MLFLFVSFRKFDRIIIQVVLEWKSQKIQFEWCNKSIYLKWHTKGHITMFYFSNTQKSSKYLQVNSKVTFGNGVGNKNM